MITNTSNVRVELDSFLSYVDLTIVTFWVDLREKKFNNALQFLDASTKDKTFEKKMSTILGTQMISAVTYWRESFMSNVSNEQDYKSSKKIKIGQSLRILLYSALLYSLFFLRLHSNF